MRSTCSSSGLGSGLGCGFGLGLGCELGLGLGLGCESGLGLGRRISVQRPVHRTSSVAARKKRPELRAERRSCGLEI